MLWESFSLLQSQAILPARRLAPVIPTGAAAVPSLSVGGAEPQLSA